MSVRRTKSLTLEQIRNLLDDYASDEEDQSVDVVILPPDADELTDHEDIDDEMMGDVNVTEVAGSLELHVATSESENIEPTNVVEKANDIHPQTLPSRKKRKLCNANPKWVHKKPEYKKAPGRTETHKNNLKAVKEQLEFATPVEIFEEIFSAEIFDLIVRETVRYATVCKNMPNITVSTDDVKKFIGILLFSSYHGLPSERHYWSNDEDLKTDVVKEAMSRRKFQELKSILHFCNNEEAGANKHDRGFKIRPLVKAIQNSFMKFGVLEENLAVDEMIVKYYGRNSLKQFIRSKPIRFGYKLWALCGVSGYCYNFDLYCGKSSTEDDRSDLLLGSKVVLNMLDVVQDPCSHNVFFDNLFTGYELLVHLRNLGFQATGTLRENRLKNVL